MKKLSALLMTLMLLVIFGCDNEDHPKPDKQPPPSPTVPQPQVK